MIVTFAIILPASNCTLSWPLVPTGRTDDAEATHYGWCGEKEKYGKYEAIASEINGAMWWIWDSETSELLDSYNGDHFGEIWAWQMCLNESGLKLVVIQP